MMKNISLNGTINNVFYVTPSGLIALDVWFIL